MDEREQLARNLFAAWSGDDADAPGRYLAADAILFDTVGGTHRGWPEIRDFFAKGLGVWSDLGFEIGDVWLNERGVALRWVMSATVPDDRFGPEHQGRKWKAPGMSELVIVDGEVVYEADHWHGGAMRESLRQG